MTASEIQRAPYGRQASAPVDSKAPVPYAGESYYGRPALKPSHYGQLVASYLFIGGVAGAGQVLATVADLCAPEKNRSIVRAGRYLALGGALASPIFLIADLQTPKRWYNMLRIFRRTSAISIGSWTLAAFGGLSALTLAAETAAERKPSRGLRRMARLFGAAAAGAGAVVATYTGTLLGATSTPLWAAASRLFPVVFGVSAAANATAALSLTAHLQNAPASLRRRLDRLALITLAAEWLAGAAVERRLEREQVAAPLNEPPRAAAYRIGYKGLGIAAPLILRGAGFLLPRRSRGLSIAAATLTLAGGYIFRSVVISAGKASGKRPGDYFRFTQG